MWQKQRQGVVSPELAEVYNRVFSKERGRPMSDFCNLGDEREHYLEGIAGNSCMQGTFVGPTKLGSNANEFRFYIENGAGVPCKINGKEMEKFELTITGDWELQDFFEIVHEAYKLYRTPLG